MRILRNYILKEFFNYFFLSLALFTFVMLVGNLLRIVSLIINKGADVWEIMKLFSYLIPYLLTYTIPISFLSATLFTLGRLSYDNEIIAISASGINIIYLVIPLLILGLIFSLILFILNDWVIPYTHFASRLTISQIGIKNPTAFLEPGVFINAFNNYIIFIYHIEGNKLFNIRIYEPQPENKPARTIVAKRGEFVGIPEKSMIKLKLIEGTTEEPDPKNPNNFYKLNFNTMFLNLNLSQDIQSMKTEKKPKDMNFKELKQQIQKLKKMGIDATPVILHLYERISLSFSCIIFALIGIPLGLITKRREKSINLGLAFLIVGIYYLFLLGAEALSINGYLPAILGIWIPNIIFGIFGLSLLYRICAY